MKLRWIVIALAAFAVIAANPADARARRHARPQCVDRPLPFSWYGVLFDLHREVRPNGCAPPVYVSGAYVGQDPDPFIRSQLLRDPATGYSSQFAR
jgi:hypothetical protein